ncbi:WecB/TagA/CpsF family glycosyltransferase [Neobacillus niacini]|uniref:WecB/TagA/CpsF family glycosyltransferase n=1 Tax=Neobacillus niacini TaxID=86668 RepID=UPI000694F4F4|nr:WecB/TagA/CpsF family glycosyltransferase [Neobacillus niacini]
MQGLKSPLYKEIIHQADYITPDGIGIVKACKWLRRPVKERITGFDLMTELLQLANQHQWKVYLLGSKSAIVSKTSSNMVEKYPNLVMAGYHHGYFTNDGHIIEEIKETQPDLIFVAMGCPRQEKWIYESIDKFSRGLFIGVGGSIDVMSGLDQRAPQRWIDMQLEWLYRIVKKPRRILLIPKLLSFIFEILKEYIALNTIVAKRKVIEKKS